MSSTNSISQAESKGLASPAEEALPDYAQNILPEVNLSTLVLISHGHSPPLKLAPQLKFDVRSLPNPPKHIRDAHNGTSRRLQEWMLSDPVFAARRDAIRSEIEARMTKMTSEHEKKDVLKVDPERSGKEDSEGIDQSHEKTRDQSPNSAQESEEEGIDDSASSDDEASHSSQEADQNGVSTLRVGISCAMGRHRSVAMVEELAKLSWPGWEVQVEHRDLFKKRSAGKKSGGKQSRGTRGGGISSLIEDD